MSEENEVVEELFNSQDDDKPVIAQAVEETPSVEEPSFNVPDKFQGKSFEDVIEAYTNLEKEHGRKANEVGELRKLTDEILKQQIERPQATQTEETKIGFDDFIDDPTQAVDKALADNPRLKQIEEALIQDRHEKTHQQLVQRHKDADELVNSPEFVDWVKASPSKLRMFQEAHTNYDVDLASDLIDMYKSGHKISTEEAILQRDEKASKELKQATVEKGGSPAQSRKVYRRADLIRLKIEQPARYAGMADEIRQAYAEGRVK